MNIYEKIKETCQNMDWSTWGRLPNGKRLILLGTEDSVFLRQIKRKADRFDVPCEIVSELPPVLGDNDCVVLDRETCSKDIRFGEPHDIDCMFTDGASSVSQAVLLTMMLADNMAHYDRKVTIVGRGHAVKGLAEALRETEQEVTVAHSGTADMVAATQGRDIVIYATPVLDKPISYDTKELVIDLSGCVPNPEKFRCPYINRIGALTVSVLLSRLLRAE